MIIDHTHPLYVKKRNSMTKDGKYNYECLEAIDVEQLNQDLTDLLNGREVDLPTFNFNAVSRKITDEKTRARLEKLVDGLKRSEGGFIIRTAGETAKPKDIKNEAKLLIKQFEEVKEKFKSANARRPQPLRQNYKKSVGNCKGKYG